MGVQLVWVVEESEQEETSRWGSFLLVICTHTWNFGSLNLSYFT